MAGQQDAARGAPGAAQGRDWKPSRFFDEWKESVAEIKGELLMQYMHFCRGMPPDIRLEAIDHILRCTMPVVYAPDGDHDGKEVTDAMYNDGDAMREYATRFLDGFWDDYWRPILARHASGAGGQPQSECA